ncbi:MAG TPA: DUF397 domain-containing protein [Verrucomicrobiae bacterium]|nr:DUF397 domain-containing protein [Verrucomicrobiae bacterium]
MDQLNWRKSSFSATKGMDNCVEMAQTDSGGIAVRNSNNPEGGMTHFTRDEMLAFLQGAKAGEFDDMVA